MALCSFCQRIPEDIFLDIFQTKHLHHPTLASLRASAAEGCRFCVALMAILGNPEAEGSDKGPVTISRYFYGALFIFVYVHGMANATRRAEYIPEEWGAQFLSTSTSARRAER